MGFKDATLGHLEGKQEPIHLSWETDNPSRKMGMRPPKGTAAALRKAKENFAYHYMYARIEHREMYMSLRAAVKDRQEIRRLEKLIGEKK